MQTITNSVHHSFENVDLHRCMFILLCGQSYIYASVLNYADNNFIFYNKVQFDEEESQINLQEYYGQYKINLTEFRKVLVFFNSTNNIITPIQENETQHFDAVSNLFFRDKRLPNSVILKDNITSQVMNIYSVCKPLYESIITLNNKNVIFCSYNSILLKVTDLKFPHVYIHHKNFARFIIDKDIFTILIYGPTTILYINNFAFTSIEDAIYRLVNIVNTLKIAEDDFCLYVGHLEDQAFQDSLVDLLLLYFSNVEIENRPVTYSYENSVVHDYPTTFLAPLFELSLCES